MSRLPEAFKEKYASKAAGAKIFDIPLEELSKEDLLLVAAAGWVEYQEQRAYAFAQGMRVAERMKEDSARMAARLAQGVSTW